VITIPQDVRLFVTSPHNPADDAATSEPLPDVLWPNDDDTTGASADATAEADRRHLIEVLARITRRIAATNERVEWD